VWIACLGCTPSMDGVDASTDGGTDAPAIDAGPPLRVASVVDLGFFPLPSDTTVGRDGVSSGAIGGAILWTFGDTFVTDSATTVDMSNVVTATGGWSTAASPLMLEQPVDSHGIPSQMVPYTAPELAQNRMDATNGWALWPGAVIDTGGSEALLLFQRIQRMNGSGFVGVGLGTAHIAPHATVATRDPNDLFSRSVGSSDPLYGTGGVSVIGDTVYWFACDSLVCRLARTPRAHAGERDAFEFYDGSAWVSDIAAAAIVIRGVVSEVSVSYNAHLGRYLAVSSQLGTDSVVLRTAPAIEGPWPTSGLTIMPSDGGILAATDGRDYLAKEHPALSSSDGREIVISYSRPLGNFRGEVHLARITLE